MPSIGPAPASRRTAFERTLTEQSRTVFRQLVRMVDVQQPHDLDWYYRLGTLTRRLRSGEPNSSSAQWVKALATALGPCDSALQKACRFVDLYPDAAAVRKLNAIGVDWVRLVFAFVVPAQAARHHLLRRAVAENWTQSELRYHIQSHFPTARRGVGGRPRRVARPLDPEGTLRHLDSLIYQVLAFQDEVFAKVTAREWAGLAKHADDAERTRVTEYAAAVQRRLGRAASVLKAAEARVGRLQGRAGRPVKSAGG